jgi:hypothetical protein
LFSVKKTSATPVIQASGKRIITPGAEQSTLFFFNNEPLIAVNKKAAKPVMIFAELSFGDVLENAMNKLKPGLVNTYDDELTELFKDAPSLLKVKCTIPF